MNTIVTFKNASTQVTLSMVVVESKSEMYRVASIKGMEIGRTSFMKLVNAKVESACGWSVSFAPEVVEDIAASEEVTLNNLITVLASKNVDTVKKVAKTEAYVTFQVKEGRIQANPKKNGSFSLMFYPRKGFGPDEISKFEVLETKSQYTRLSPLTATEIAALV